MRYLLNIKYDGSLFYGSQKQKNKMTICGELEKVINKVFNENIKLIACSRTDKGVHANDYYIHFDSDKEYEVNKLKYSINQMIDDNIFIKNIKIVSDEFHARYSVKEKEYLYKINIKEYNPVERNYIYQYCNNINIELLKKACLLLEGTHNFKSFTSGTYEDYARCINNITIEEKENYIYIYIKASGFLRYMVRNIVGFLLDINEGKKNIDEIINVIEMQDRTLLNEMAPACGLYLNKVVY